MSHVIQEKPLDYIVHDEVVENWKQVYKYEFSRNFSNSAIGFAYWLIKFSQPQMLWGKILWNSGLSNEIILGLSFLVIIF